MAKAPVPQNIPGLLGAFGILSLVAGLLAAGLAVPGAAATGLASNNAVDAFMALPSDLETTQVSATTRVLASDGSLIATFYDENRTPVKLAKISKYLQDGVIAIEDERFREHGGVDSTGLLRALVVNQIAGDASQGASTLTQQLVKNLLKQAAYAQDDEDAYNAASAKSNSRKLREIRLATALEKKMTKDEILEGYLNIAWFGRQTNGVQAAAKYYFGTTAEKLSLAQAAMLAGMIQSPTMYDISDPDKLEKAEVRRNLVLRNMLAQGKITQAEHDEAERTPIRPKITPTYQGCANAGTRGYFCDYVYNVITKDSGFEALGETQEERETAIKRGGYTIRTTLDPKVLKAAWDSVKTRIPPNDPSRVATATATVEPGTGKVLSLIQNKFYNPKQSAKNTTINYATDYKYGGSSGFQTGSTFKPATLAAWLDAGHSLYDQLEGSAGTLPENSFSYCGQNLQSSASYTFTNSADGEGQGMMSVWDATKNSVNGPYIRMTQKLDMCDIQDMATKLGMHRAQSVIDPCIAGNYSAKAPKMTNKVPQCQPSVTLGTASQSPLTMANAYATFASGGVRCNPTVVTSIKDRNGKSLKVPGANCKRTISAAVANTVALGLSKTLTEGTAKGVGALASGQPASVKTGTTNRSQDTWFVGFTPQLATAVWVGPETVNGKRPFMRNITINGTYYSAVYGSSIGGKIWKDVMAAALQGKPVKQFPDAAGNLVGTPPAPPEPEETEEETPGGATPGGGNTPGNGDTPGNGNTPGNGDTPGNAGPGNENTNLPGNGR